MNTKLQIFDSTLRDGAQSANISFSVEDKLKVIETLDELGGMMNLEKRLQILS